jgi:hypothetical protein
MTLPCTSRHVLVQFLPRNDSTSLWEHAIHCTVVAKDTVYCLPLTMNSHHNGQVCSRGGL